MLIGDVGASPASSKSSLTSSTNRFALTPSDGPYSGDNPEIATTDNKSTVTQIDPANERTPSFSQALHEKIEPQKPQPGQDKTEPETEDPSSEAVLAKQTPVKANGNDVTLEVEVGNIVKNTLCTVPAQLASTQKPAIAAAAPAKENAIKTDDLCQLEAGAETPNKPAKLAASPQAQKQLSVSAQVPNSTGEKPAELTSQTPKTENGLLLTVDQSQPGLKTVSHDSSGDTLIAELQSGEGKNVGKIQVADKTFIATECLTSQQTGKELTTGKESTTGAPGTISTTTIVSEKTPVLEAKLPVPEDNASQTQQKVSVGPGKSALTTGEPADNKTDISQQGRDPVLQNAAKCEPAQILSELPPGSGKESRPAGNNASGDSILQKLNPAQVQMSTAQTKDPGSSTADNGPNPDFEQIPSHNSAQIQVTEQSFTSSQAAKTANNASTNDVSPDVSTQLQEHIHSSLRQGDQQITIRLNPPELGRVFVRFQEQENQIIGLLEVSKAQTRYEIEQAIPQIIRNLQDSGVQIKRLDVVLTNQPEQQPYKDQSLQDGAYQPRGFSDGKHSDNTSDNEWLTNDDGYQNIPEPQVQITDSSINVLI